MFTQSELKKNREPFVPIYRKLFEFYKKRIDTQVYSPGQRIDSIVEMQQRYNISRETAKCVLQMLADEGLIIKKAGKGSFVARLGPKKKIWAVIVPFFSSQIDELIHNLRYEALHCNRQLEHFIDYNNWQEEIRLVGSLINQNYEAIIVIPTFDESKTASFYNKLHSGGTIVSLLDHTMVGSKFTFVIQSYDLGVRRAVKYLIQKCKGSLAFVKNNIWLGRNMIQEVMQQTFEKFIQVDDPTRKSILVENFYIIDRSWVINNKIHGFFCCDDADAVRVAGRIKECGLRIPQDISIISYGNTYLAQYFSPAITSIDPHYQEMSRLIVEIINNSLQGKNVSMSQYVLSPDIIIRET